MTEVHREERVACYLALSECFKEPDRAFVEQVVDGSVNQAVACTFDACGLGHDILAPAWISSSDIDEATELFIDAYYALFKGPFPPYVVPVESVYRPWSESPIAATEARGRDMIMGDPAVEMLKRYKADRIEIPGDFKPYPDHIALLLEYGGLLLERGEPGVHAEFVRNHLPWVTELRRDIFEMSDNPFYRWTADVLCRFADHELALAGGRIAADAPTAPSFEPAPIRAAAVFDN